MFIRSLLFNIGFWTLVVFFGLGGLPFALIYRPFALLVAQGWGVSSLWLLRVLCGITYEVRGRENIPQGPAIIASKHQSAWDTIIFWTLVKRPVFVLKHELIFIPIFGWQLLLLKSIYINRKAGTAAMKRMLRQAKQRINEGRQLVIFPEGTRTVPGAKPVYHPGVAALYQHLSVPVVPVALNSGYLWQKNAFIKKPGVITIEFMNTIAPGMKSRDFMAYMENIIEEKCQIL